MRLMNRLFLMLGLVFATSGAPAASTQARLLLSHESARAGDTVMAGIQLTMRLGWHTYWRISGSSGDSTRMVWTLPNGVTAGESQWPLPEKLIADGGVGFVYHNETVLLVPLKLAADLPAGPLTIKA